MPTVDASRSLLAAGANYNAGDWATVGAETSLDFLATASLNRGLDIGIGIEALARLDGAIRQNIAADVTGQAHAAARVRAQVQMPLDLFDEAGVAVRLQAVAEAAAGVQLGIGLNIAHHPDLPDRPATSLAACGAGEIDLGYFLETLAEMFGRWLNIWRGQGLAPVRTQWLKHAHAPGTALKANLPDGSVMEGLFAGLDNDGALILRLANGTSHAIHAGDIFLI